MTAASRSIRASASIPAAVSQCTARKCQLPPRLSKAHSRTPSYTYYADYFHDDAVNAQSIFAPFLPRCAPRDEPPPPSSQIEENIICRLFRLGHTPSAGRDVTAHNDDMKRRLATDVATWHNNNDARAGRRNRLYNTDLTRHARPPRSYATRRPSLPQHRYFHGHSRSQKASQQWANAGREMTHYTYTPCRWLLFDSYTHRRALILPTPHGHAEILILRHFSGR